MKNLFVCLLLAVFSQAVHAEDNVTWLVDRGIVTPWSVKCKSYFFNNFEQWSLYNLDGTSDYGTSSNRPTPPLDTNNRNWFEKEYDDASWDILYGPFEMGKSENYYSMPSPTGSTDEYDQFNSANYLRRTINIDKSSLGKYERVFICLDTWSKFKNLAVNGKEVSAYDARYPIDMIGTIYDVTDYLEDGDNSIAIVFSPDWTSFDMGVFETEQVSFCSDKLVYTGIIEDGELIGFNITGTNLDPFGWNNQVNIPSTIAYDGREYPVVEIAPGALRNYNIMDINISNGVKRIGDFALADNNFTNIYIPASVEKIGNAITGLSDYLEYINVDPENKVYDSRNNCNAIIETVSNTLVQGCKETTISHGITEIGPYSFYGIPIGSIEIPSFITTIGHHAFQYCQGLLSVTLDEGVQNLGTGTDDWGGYVFDNCTQLSKVSLPTTLTNVNGVNFTNCPALTDITANMTAPYKWIADDGKIIDFEFDKTKRNNCFLQVPASCGANYANALTWADFNLLEGKEPFDKGAEYKNEIKGGIRIASYDGIVVPSYSGNGQLMNYDASTGIYSVSYNDISCDFSFFFYSDNKKDNGAPAMAWGANYGQVYDANLQGQIAMLTDPSIPSLCKGITYDYKEGNKENLTIQFWFDAEGAHYKIDRAIQTRSLGTAGAKKLNQLNRVWQWDTSSSEGKCWGNMGYCGGSADNIYKNCEGQWWGVANDDDFAENMNQTGSEIDCGDGHLDSYMVFDHDGKVTSYKADGTVIRTSTYRLDPNSRSYNSEFAPYEMTTESGSGILWPFSMNSNGMVPQNYEVIHLDDDGMMLCYPDGGNFESLGSWSEATYWRFKPTGEPQELFVFGNDGKWDITSPSATLYKEGDILSSGTYSGDITIANVNEGFGYFTLGTGLCDDADDWSTFNSDYRLGALSKDMLLEEGSTTTIVKGLDTSYKIAVGTYHIEVNVKTGELKISEPSSISPVTVTTSHNTTYTIDGKKVITPRSGQIYIRNKRKVFNKD